MSLVFEKGAALAAQTLVEGLSADVLARTPLLELLTLAFMEGSLYGAKPNQAHRDAAERYREALKERGERPCRAQ